MPRKSCIEMYEEFVKEHEKTREAFRAEVHAQRHAGEHLGLLHVLAELRRENGDEPAGA
jgi:hypothetical protein